MNVCMNYKTSCSFTLKIACKTTKGIQEKIFQIFLTTFLNDISFLYKVLIAKIFKFGYTYFLKGIILKNGVIFKKMILKSTYSKDF